MAHLGGQNSFLQYLPFPTSSGGKMKSFLANFEPFGRGGGGDIHFSAQNKLFFC